MSLHPIFTNVVSFFVTGFTVVSSSVLFAQAVPAGKPPIEAPKTYLVIEQGSLYESKGNRLGLTGSIELTESLLKKLSSLQYGLSCVFRTTAETTGSIEIEYKFDVVENKGKVRYTSSVDFRHRYFENRTYNAKNYTSQARSYSKSLEDHRTDQFGDAGISVGRGGSPAVIENFLTLELANSIYTSNELPKASFIPIPGIALQAKVPLETFSSRREFLNTSQTLDAAILNQFVCAVVPVW